MNTHTTATAQSARTHTDTLLGGRGFSPYELARLVELRRRYRRGDLTEISVEHKRLEFARWLVQHRRLTDELDPLAPPPGTPQESAA